MMPLKKRYIAYMLRLWQVTHAGHTDWQASLEEPHSGKQIGFANLASLLKYLKEQMDRERESEATLADEEG
jgi:hypothetical protein